MDVSIGQLYYVRDCIKRGKRPRLCVVRRDAIGQVAPLGTFRSICHTVELVIDSGLARGWCVD